MTTNKSTKKSLEESVSAFRLALFDAVELYFKENFPQVPLVVKRKNIDQRIRVFKLNDPWIKDFKKHNLCFKVLISKANSPCINKFLHLFLTKVFDIIKTQDIKEDIKNIETVKSYFPLIEIMMI